MFLTVVLEAETKPSKFTTLLDKLFVRCVGPSIITSVLTEFSNRK